MRIHFVAALFVLSVGHENLVVGSETCVEKCTEECEAICPEKKICSKDEIDCGPGSPPENPFCEVDRVCVAKNCNCKWAQLNL